MEFFTISLLNGFSYGLLLFMLSSGLTLIFSMMGVLNFAHASFYMLGAYLGFTISRWVGFVPALILAPLLVGALGALFERTCLRRVRPFGHVPELLITFGLSYLLIEVVQIIWGRLAVDYRKPEWLDFAAFHVFGTQFPAYRTFMMGVALAMLGMLYLLITRTRIGLVIQAALTHPETVEALGHNVPRIFTGVFGGGAALAGLAGVVGGAQFVTEPAMAITLGPIIFVVVVVGGMGSLPGAFVASVLIGVLDAFAVGSDGALADLVRFFGADVGPSTFGWAVLKVKISQVAAIMPYLLLVLILIFRPKGLLGTREG
ncbi:MAG: branched-chain amino acid ABC transporter permease [Burkholderiales bacterium]|nr:branched-chain amino acid ABC transporter permease [Burkholderiales bacterium]